MLEHPLGLAYADAVLRQRFRDDLGEHVDVVAAAERTYWEAERGMIGGPAAVPPVVDIRPAKTCRRS